MFTAGLVTRSISIIIFAAMLIAIVSGLTSATKMMKKQVTGYANTIQKQIKDIDDDGPTTTASFANTGAGASLPLTTASAA